MWHRRFDTLMIMLLCTGCMLLSRNSSAVPKCVVTTAEQLQKALTWAHSTPNYPETEYAANTATCLDDSGKSLITIKGTIIYPSFIVLTADWGIHLQGIENARIIFPTGMALMGSSFCSLALKSNAHKIDGIALEVQKKSMNGLCIMSSNNIILKNTISTTLGHGIYIDGTGNSITANTITSSSVSTGMTLKQNGNTIKDNTISSNGNYGIYYLPDTLTCVHDANTVTTTGSVAHNTCAASTDGTGKEDPPDPAPPPGATYPYSCTAQMIQLGMTICCDPQTEYPNFLTKTCAKSAVKDPTKPAPSVSQVSPTMPFSPPLNKEGCTLLIQRHATWAWQTFSLFLLAAFLPLALRILLVARIKKQ